MEEKQLALPCMTDYFMTHNDCLTIYIHNKLDLKSLKSENLATLVEGLLPSSRTAPPTAPSYPTTQSLLHTPPMPPPRFRHMYLRKKKLEFSQSTIDLRATFKYTFFNLGLQFVKLFFLLKKEMSYVLDVMAKYLTLKNF